MRAMVLTAILGLGTGVARADEASDLLAKAIKATGQTEDSVKRKFCHIKQSGVIYLPNGAAASRRECWMELPERIKWAGEMQSPKGVVPFVAVLNGLTGWAKAPTLAELSPKDYESTRNEAYTMWVASLAPSQSRSIKWEVQKDGTVNDRPTKVLKATASNRPTVHLHLDRDTMLVVKCTYSGDENLAAVTKDYVFSGHRNFGDVKWPAKVQVFDKGKKIEEWNNESVQFPEKIDAREFAKP